MKSSAKYAVLVEDLRRQIRADYRVGDRLPTLAELRGRYGVSNSTMERVYVLLEQEGLIVREHGRGTFVTDPGRKEKTGLIGFIGDDSYLAPQTSYVSPYIASVAEGIRGTMARANRQLLLLDRESGKGLEKVEGVLVWSAGLSDPILKSLPSGLPCVSLLAVRDDTASVVADDQGGAKQAVQYLIEQGHKRIACLMEPTSQISLLRQQGYREALEEAGIEVRPSWMHPLSTGRNRQNYRIVGFEDMREWLRTSWAESRCTALFVQNDLVGVGALQALHEAGYRVPGEVSVIGFDGTEICDYSQPRLTSVAVPLHEIGALGSELLLRQIDTGITDASVTRLPTQLRTGESVSGPQGVESRVYAMSG